MSSPNMKLEDNAQKQTLNSIKSLQNLEKELYLKLGKLPSENANQDQRQIVINRINDISQTRISLFQQLNSMYLSINHEIENKQNDLIDQVIIVNTIEDELKISKNAMNKIDKNNIENKNSIKNKNNDNLRMTEINTYYSKRYKAHYKIILNIIYLCIPLLVLALLNKRYLISSTVTNILGGFIFLFGLFLILPQVADLYFRNNMVFDEYDFPFDSTNSPDVTEHDNDKLNDINNKNKIKNIDDYCIGPNCCSPGMEFNDKQNSCVIINPNDKESSISGQSTQTPGSSVNKSSINKQELVV